MMDEYLFSIIAHCGVAIIVAMTIGVVIGLIFVTRRVVISLLEE